MSTITKTHSPGKWHTCADNTQINAGDVYVALVHWSKETQEHADANARLIAAAPEMLEALELLSKCCAANADVAMKRMSNFGEFITLKNMCDAAIRKARGEQ